MKDAGSKPSSVILVKITSPYSSFPKSEVRSSLKLKCIFVPLNVQLRTSQALTIKNCEKLPALCIAHFDRRYASNKTCSCCGQTAFLLLPHETIHCFRLLSR